MLDWNLEWGPQIKHLMRIANNGQRVQALESRPVPSSHVSWIWEGYATLDQHRQWGQGFPQPIQLSEITAYALIAQLSPSDLLQFREMVHSLDSAYLERMANRRKNA